MIFHSTTSLYPFRFPLSNKMNPKLRPTLLPAILVFLAITIRTCLCQTNPQYETCNRQFECGSFRGLRYPFWGGNRPSICGYQGFELSCRDNTPILNISSVSYRVVDHDDNDRTLRVARDDLWDNLCPTPAINTTLNFTLFDYSSSANDRNITLFYGCSQATPPVVANQFTCAVNTVDTLGFYVLTDAVGMTNGMMCNTNIHVPVNRTAAEVLANPAATSRDLLQSSLQSGFSIEWSADDDDCDDCTLSGGLCGRNPELASFACHCTDGTGNRTCGTGNGTTGSQKRLFDHEVRVVIGVSLGVLAIVISSIIIFYIRGRSRSCSMDLEINRKVDKFPLNHGSLAPKRYTYRDIKKITKSFTDKLGQGGFGIVYKGKLPGGGLVAVKVLTDTTNDGEEFINEVASISRTSHVNIVNLLGYCYEQKRRALIYEFMPNKSLDKFINNGSVSDGHLEWEKLYEIAVGVARGLEYLHRGCNTRIVHFDIKPQNILLDKDFCPRIADFGLAKLVKEKQSMLSMLGARGTVGYIAPEVFSRSFGGVSYKSDVYSYGMMLLEMAGAREVAEIQATKSSVDYFPDKIYEHVLVNNEKLDGDVISEEKEETSRKMLLVGLWCIQTAPSDRPSMTKVVEMLEGNLQSIEIPPKPSLFCSTLSVKQISSSTSVIVEIESSTHV